MINAQKTNKDIVYRNYRSSGIASSKTNSTVTPNALSNMTRGYTFTIAQSKQLSKPISKVNK